MSHKSLQKKGNRKKITQSLVVFDRGQSENVLFKLIGNKQKRLPGAEDWKESVFNGKKNFLIKKYPARLYLELLPHRCCGSVTLVFCGQLMDCRMRDGLCEVCFERPNLASKDESKWNTKNNASRWHFPKTNIQVHYEFLSKMSIKVLSNAFSMSFHLQHNACI